MNEGDSIVRGGRYCKNKAFLHLVSTYLKKKSVDPRCFLLLCSMKSV